MDHDVLLIKVDEKTGAPLNSIVPFPFPSPFLSAASIISSSSPSVIPSHIPRSMITCSSSSSSTSIYITSINQSINQSNLYSAKIVKESEALEHTMEQMILICWQTDSLIIIIIIIIIITDLYSAFRSEDTEALDAAQED